MRFGVAVFPGTWSDRDCAHAVQLAGHEAVMLWHKDRDLHGVDCVILPGGFSYGDYLRTGAVARFAPLMEAVQSFADSGGLVWGICNGFQILCEAHMLPGALVRNGSLQFRCEPSWLRVVGDASPNGSLRDIAGIVSEQRNVLGMMPHPERACEPLLGSADGMELIRSVAGSLARTASFA